MSRHGTPRRAFGACGGHPSDAGFTLLELLLSLALLALIAAVASSGLRFGARAWQGAAELDQAAESGAVRNWLEQRLAEAMPLYEREPSGNIRIAFEGAADRLLFLAPAAGGPGVGGVYRHEIAARGDGMLRLERSLYRRAARLPGDWRTLLEGIAGASFRYFGRDRPGAPPAWHAEWPRGDRLPELIEINVTFGADDRRSWHPLVIAPRIRSSD